jgi:phosphatidylserine/phosphatidylglycerophosphate/cardiolipin synthase-like enzyme
LPANAQLDAVAADISSNTTSSLLYSLAFLYQTPGVIQDAIKKVMNDPNLFVYGISDRKVGGLEVQTPDGNVAPVYPSQLTGKGAPEPFKSEPTGGSGVRMHHKFVVIDFDKPTARVYLGSYNFSTAADTQNGENLVLIRDRRIAVSYAVEALTLFDHYEFRVLQNNAKTAKTKLELQLPPRDPGNTPWWSEDYTNPRKIRDRELFA